MSDKPTTKVPLRSARIVRGEMLQDTLSAARQHENARHVLEEAETAAVRRATEIEREATRRSAVLRTNAERDLRRKVAEVQKKTALAGTREILEATARVHQKVDSLTPWVEDIAVMALERIIGEIPAERRLKLIVTQAIDTMRSGLVFTLRVSNDLIIEAGDLPKMLVGTPYEGLIGSVEVEKSMLPETAILISEDAALDISIPTQLEMLRAELKEMLSDVAAATTVDG